MNTCKFCNLDDSEFLYSNSLIKIFKDTYPVTDGHLLIIPVRHVSSWWELSSEEVRASMMAIDLAKGFCGDVDGYNIGINIGEAAGQTVDHVHIHLIPRRFGDMDDPTGGVRGVIPEKRVY